MIYFGKTDVGKKRKGNQDSFGIYPLADNALLLAVCDGMGGIAGGDEASKLALLAFSEEVKTVCSIHSSDGKVIKDKVDMHILTENAAELANKAVYRASKENSELEGMGTTLVALLIIDGYAHSVNVGDSRMYRIKGDKIEQLTHDHSYVQYLVDMGKLTPEEAKNSTKKNIITRAVGTGDNLEADIENIELSCDGEPEYFLLCSDGLTNMVSDEEILDIVSSDMGVEEKVNTLITKANENGGADNITAVLLCR